MIAFIYDTVTLFARIWLETVCVYWSQTAYVCFFLLDVRKTGWWISTLTERCSVTGLLQLPSGSITNNRIFVCASFLFQTVLVWNCNIPSSIGQLSWLQFVLLRAKLHLHLSLWLFLQPHCVYILLWAVWMHCKKPHLYCLSAEIFPYGPCDYGACKSPCFCFFHRMARLNM